MYPRQDIAGHRRLVRRFSQNTPPNREAISTQNHTNHKNHSSKIINPLRLASLAASPFCGAKRGGGVTSQKPKHAAFMPRIFRWSGKTPAYSPDSCRYMPLERHITGMARHKPYRDQPNPDAKITPPATSDRA